MAKRRTAMLVSANAENLNPPLNIATTRTHGETVSCRWTLRLSAWLSEVRRCPRPTNTCRANGFAA